jgi:rhodanese-related sulfurtransferase
MMVNTMAKNSISRALLDDKLHRRQIKQFAVVDSREPADYAEAHSPTESVQIVMSHTATAMVDDRGERAVRVTRTVEQSRQRITDARLWASLDDDQQGAMLEIEEAWRGLCAGLGVKPGQWEIGTGGSGEPSDGKAASAIDYIRWLDEVDGTLKLDADGMPMRFGRGKAAERWTLERLVPEAATAIICEGKSVRTVAADRGKHPAWVTENLKQALNVWLYRSNRKERKAIPDEPSTGGLTLKQVLTRQLNRRVARIQEVDDEKLRVGKGMWK